MTNMWKSLLCEGTPEFDENYRKQCCHIPLKRFGNPEEVGDVCVFLASDMATYISGQTISVCGALHT